MYRCARSCFVSVSRSGGGMAGPRGATRVRERTMADQRRLHPFSRPLNPRAVRLLVCVLHLTPIYRVSFFFYTTPQDYACEVFLFAGCPSVPARVTKTEGNDKATFQWDLSWPNQDHDIRLRIFWSTSLDCFRARA